MTLILTTGCSPQLETTEPSRYSQQPLNNTQQFLMSRRFEKLTPQSASQIQVFNQFNIPLQNAKIMIGTGADKPFTNNMYTTDHAGLVQIGSEWSMATHITVEAKGYIRQTLLNQEPGLIQIKLNPYFQNPRNLINGQVTQLPVKNSDKNIDFALVLPTLTRSSLLNFNLEQVISPSIDEISIVGQKIQLPSNVSLPTQKENYFLPITLSKPNHRVYSNSSGQQTYFALAGRFPFKPVVDQMNSGKQFYEVVNMFNFTSGGLREINISQSKSELNIPGHEMAFDKVVKVKGAVASADEVVLTVAVNEVNNQFIPTDVKRIDGNAPGQLNTLSQKPVHIVSLLKKQVDFNSQLTSADRSTASLNEHTPDSQSVLLPLISAPKIIAQSSNYNVLIEDIPVQIAEVHQITPLATSIVISTLEKKKENNLDVILADRLWEIIGTGWNRETILPEWPLDFNQTQPLKFEVNLIGSQKINTLIPIGDELIKSATHITHSATELE